MVGRVFWEEPVARALGGSPPVDEGSGGLIADRLLLLERRGFLARRPAPALPGQAEYGFRHALIHDVAYGSIPLARRARAHAEVGAWLEEMAGERRDEVAELLADHFGRAAGEGAELAWSDPADREAVRSAAFEHLLAAGAVACRRFAVAKAVELHDRAVGLAADDPERLRAFEALGDDHESAYHGDAAVWSWLQALEIARVEPARRPDRARLCAKLAWLMTSVPGAFRCNPDPAQVEAFVAEGLEAAVGDEAQAAWLLLARGISAQLWRGSEPFGQGLGPDPVPIERRIADVRAGLAVGERAGLADLVAAAEHALGVVYGITGRYGEVMELARKKLRQLDQVASRLDRADILRRAAVHSVNLAARFEEGAELARRCHELSVDTNPHQLMHATWPRLAALYHLGRWQELTPLVEEHMAAFSRDPAIECQFVRDGPVIGATVLAQTGAPRRARALAAVAGDPMAEPETASAWQARYALASGDPETARAIAADKALEGRMYGPQHALVLLEALLALGDWAAVAEFLPAARASVAGNALLAPHCDRAEGLLHGERGRRLDAARALRKALARFEELRIPFEAARTRERLAAFEPPAVARRLREAARSTYRRLGAAPPS